MLTTSWEKIDKFYLVFVFIMIVMAFIIIVSFRGVFNAYSIAQSINESGEGDLLINKENLNEAYNWTKNKETLPLEVRE